MTSADPASLQRRHEALEADLECESKRPLPDFMRIKRLKQLKLKIKDTLAARGRGPVQDKRA